MPKINFDVQLVTETGESVTRPKIDNRKIKVQANGNAQAEILKDLDGNVVLENVMVKDLLTQILSAAYPGDDQIPFQDRVKRGKLARKIATSKEANYRTEELAIIEDLSSKVASTALITQLDGLMNGVEDEVAA
jgi:hypothetical protein